ncbi:MAG: hypothetical protein CYPHOPRED_000218 [Cyphobasidiales sp. Tagirdzhanova-0007]|nr:MAG: hypothetical protein CYPHOPRED_000218 [Cyphobasidiales sp. Tagirdzhanova-0007]
MSDPATASTSTSEEVVLPIPDLALAQERFILSQSKLSHLHDAAKKKLKEGIERDEMGAWLQSDPILQSAVDDKPEGVLYKTLKEKNVEELKKLNEKITDADANHGETELSDALRAKASYLAKIGKKEEALEAYEYALSKQAGLGAKIDLRLSMIRVGFFAADFKVVSTNIEKTRDLIESGGDWDRRNRLKVYQGIYLLCIRDFKAGGTLLFDTISTFTATELISYEDFIALCIIAGVLCLPRKELKQKIIDSPEVIAVLPNLPHLQDFTSTLYNTEYAKFFRALAEVEEHHLIPNRVLEKHTRYYVKEMRIKAYAQLLESYRSVTLKSLADAFGIGERFLEADLSKFISAGRLNCSIDRVNGIVETNRPDAKNARYEQAIKQGDVLLNSLQKLSRVIG